MMQLPCSQGDNGGPHLCILLSTSIVVPDYPVDYLSNSHMLGFGFSLDLLNKGFFNVNVGWLVDVLRRNMLQRILRCTPLSRPFLGQNK
jgi:hypothetical protein